MIQIRISQNLLYLKSAEGYRHNGGAEAQKFSTGGS
jgi:hypothetical protein